MSLERRRWPNFASWLCSHSPQQAPFIPSPALCCAENGHRLLLQLLRAEMVLFLSRVRSEWDAFHFLHFFPSGYAGSGVFFVFVFLSDKEVVRGRRRLLLRYPLLFNFPFFHVHFMAVTTAVEGLNVVEPHCTLQGGSSLTLQSFHFFSPPYSCLWAGQRRPESLRQ